MRQLYYPDEIFSRIYRDMVRFYRGCKLAQTTEGDVGLATPVNLECQDWSEFMKRDIGLIDVYVARRK